MGQVEVNATVAALDRAAARLGLKLETTGRNRRVLRAFGRELRYAPGGAGIVHVQAYIDGTLEASSHKTLDQMHQLFLRASQ